MIRTLQRAPELGINFIDTADSYGPGVSEPLIKEALAPYPGILVATKAGLTRPGPGQWEPRGEPDYLIRQAHRSLKTLGVEQIGLWQLHRIDPRVAATDQFGAVKTASGRWSHPPRRLERSYRGRHRGSIEDLQGRNGPEPLQSGRPPVRKRAGLLRSSRDWLHPLVPARSRGSGASRAPCWTKPPRSMGSALARLLSPGCSSAARSCCRSRELRRSRT